MSQDHKHKQLDSLLLIIEVDHHLASRQCLRNNIVTPYCNMCSVYVNIHYEH